MNDHVCARCAVCGPACCIVPPEREHLCFPLTSADIARIAPHAPAIPWHVSEPNNPGLLHTLTSLFAEDAAYIRAMFPPHGEHQRLATDERGRCLLLSDSGCVLPVAARPLHCLLYPFWMRGQSIMLMDTDCLALDEARGTAMLMRSLGMTPAMVRELYADLRASLGLAAWPVATPPRAPEAMNAANRGV